METKDNLPEEKYERKRVNLSNIPIKLPTKRYTISDGALPYKKPVKTLHERAERAWESKSRKRIRLDDLLSEKISQDEFDSKIAFPEVNPGIPLITEPITKMYNREAKYERNKVSLRKKAKKVFFTYKSSLHGSLPGFPCDIESINNLKNQILYFNNGETTIPDKEGTASEFKKAAGKTFKAFLCFLKRIVLRSLLTHDAHLSRSDASMLYLVIRNFMTAADYEYFYNAFLKEPYKYDFEDIADSDENLVNVL